MEFQEAVGNVRIDGGEETGQLAYFLHIDVAGNQ